tara:strand:+ start:135 stop:884 length:750 start_codon:yes stop_codon:yes gene_type:complete
MRVLILGHSGMLGSAVKKYYSFAEVETLEDRWPTDEFQDKVSSFDGDLIINCIGSIPQRTNDFSINLDIPEFLCRNCLPKVKIINPTSDCVFEGTKDTPYNKYDKCDATSDYGKSKCFSPPTDCKNFKSIRTSVIGYDKDGVELLSWFLNSKEPVRGYANHWWSGITTHGWAEVSYKLYTEWESFPENLIQIGTTPITKLELLKLINSVFNAKKKIVPFSTEKSVNRSLVSDFPVESIINQLEKLNLNS